MTSSNKKLTPKQERFVLEYLIDLNATQAAIRAGYSEKTAKEQGYENLSKPHINDAVQAAKAKRAQKTGISTEYVIDNLQRVFEKAMTTSDWSAATRALDLLGRHTGAFEKDNKQKRSVIRITSNV